MRQEKGRKSCKAEGMGTRLEAGMKLNILEKKGEAQVRQVQRVLNQGSSGGGGGGGRRRRGLQRAGGC